MRIMDKIRNREILTPTESTLALFLQQHAREATTMSLNELSETLHASKSSIIRFCKKLGYKGHKELCVQLAKELDTFVFDNRELNLSLPFLVNDDKKSIAQKTYTLSMGAMNETWSDLDIDQLYKISKILYERKNLYVYAGEDGYLLARDFTLKLETIGFHVYLKSTPGTNVQQACLEDRDSIALFIYYDEPTEELLRIAKILSSKKVPIVAITGPEKGPVTKYASETISVSYYEPSPKVAGFGSFTAIQLILNIMYAYIFNMDYEKNMQAIMDIDENRKKYQITKAG